MHVLNRQTMIVSGAIPMRCWPSSQCIPRLNIARHAISRIGGACLADASLKCWHYWHYFLVDFFKSFFEKRTLGWTLYMLQSVTSFIRLGFVSLPDSRRDIYPCVILPLESGAFSEIRATSLIERLFFILSFC